MTTTERRKQQTNRESTIEIAILRRDAESDGSYIESRLKGLGILKRRVEISVNGVEMIFNRHENGDGWVEKSAKVPKDVYVSKDSIVLAGTDLSKGVAAVYGRGTDVDIVYKEYYD